MENGFHLDAATGTHRGDRPYQQDRVALLAHPRVNGCVLGVLADGMGGRTGGRKAADQVLLTATQLFDRFVPDTDDPAALLQQISMDAHLVIKLTAVTAEQEPHSTIAAFLITPRADCFWIHAGDSRLYQFRDGRPMRQTSDHSYVQTLVDRGELTPEQAIVHPQANILTSCLGTESDPKLETRHIPRLQIGDSLLACSDGLWHYFTSDEIGAIVQALQPRDACELLIEKARSRAGGTGDNLSAIVVRIDALPEPKRPRTTRAGTLDQ